MAFTLPRLPPTAVTPEDMQVWWQQVVEAIEAQENTQNGLIADLAAAQADITAAQADITAAIRDIARLSSYTAPTNVVTAADVGTDATITIAGHDRIYPGSFVPDLTVVGGSITGKAFSTTYYIYYDDPTLADTTPVFLATTDIATAQVGAADGRHFVGFVTTPADGGGSTSGGGGRPPGGGGGDIP